MTFHRILAFHRWAVFYIYCQISLINLDSKGVVVYIMEVSIFTHRDREYMFL